jgi:hypothetical protein
MPMFDTQVSKGEKKEHRIDERRQKKKKSL